MDLQYQEKYLKYKSKYLNLKKQSLVQSGGAPTCAIKVPSKEHIIHSLRIKEYNNNNNILEKWVACNMCPCSGGKVMEDKELKCIKGEHDIVTDANDKNIHVGFCKKCNNLSLKTCKEQNIKVDSSNMNPRIWN